MDDLKRYRIWNARRLREIEAGRVRRYVAAGFIDLDRALDPVYRGFLAREWQWNAGRFGAALDTVLEERRRGVAFREDSRGVRAARDRIARGL